MQREIIRVEPIDSNFEKWGAPVSTCTRAGNMVFVSKYTQKAFRTTFPLHRAPRQFVFHPAIRKKLILDVERATLETAQRQVDLAGAYAAYQRLLADAGCIDFGDQVALAVRLLEEHPAVRRAVRDRYRYVLVDEFQDTDPAQLRLLEALVGPRGSVTIVGDDDQAIYGFRGSHGI